MNHRKPCDEIELRVRPVMRLVLYHYVVAQLYATRLGITYEIVLKNIRKIYLESKVKYKVYKI